MWKATRLAKCEYCGEPAINTVSSFCRECRDALSSALEKVRPITVKALGFVYAVTSAEHDSGLIKIGHTTQVEKRLQCLQVGSPVLLKVIGFGHGGPEDEKTIHRWLRDHNHHGEWFLRTPETMEAVEFITADKVVDFIGEIKSRRALRRLK